MDTDKTSDIIEAVIALATSQSTALYPTEKYGGTMFLTDPEKQGSFAGGVFAYDDHVTVEFSKGADFDDPVRLLAGKGKARRHVKLRDLSEIRSKGVDGFLKQALR